MWQRCTEERHGADCFTGLEIFEILDSDKELLNKYYAQLPSPQEAN
jgi:hypothetical protein